MITIAVEVEDLQKIILAANQMEALLSLLPHDSPVVSLLEPMDTLFGNALYGPNELASAVKKVSEGDEEGDAA